MSEQWGSPKTMSRSGTALSPLKGKAYLPSRYSHELVQSKGGTQDILNSNMWRT